MEVNNKFDIGEEVYVVLILNASELVTCPRCEGSGYLYTKSNNEVECNECNNPQWHHKKFGETRVNKRCNKAQLLFETARKITDISSMDVRTSIKDMRLIYNIEGYSSSFMNPDPMGLDLYITEDIMFINKQNALDKIKEINKNG